MLFLLPSLIPDPAQFKMWRTLRGLVWFVTISTLCAAYCCLFRLVYFILCTGPFEKWKRRLETYENNRVRHVTVRPEDWLHTVGTWRMLRGVLYDIWNTAFVEALNPGHTAPDVQLYQLHVDGTTTVCRLLDFAKHGRPLVINFGSCT